MAPRLAKHSVTRVMLPFSTVYLCETAFSALVTIKTKARNRLNVHQDLRLAVTSITPDIPGEPKMAMTKNINKLLIVIVTAKLTHTV